MKKRILSLFLTLVILTGIMPTAFADGGTDISVYLSVSSYGEAVKDKDGNSFAYLPVDLSGKENYNLDDVLRAAHIKYHPDGETAYESSSSNWGLSISKLWGDTSYNFGYQVNKGTETVMDLEHEAENGDYIDAFIYRNDYEHLEAYSYFDKLSVNTTVGKPIKLTLNAASGYDDNGYLFAACSDAAITVDGKKTDIVTNKNGEAQISFDEPGKYVISARKTQLVGKEETTAITAPFCVATVTEDPAIEIMHNIAARCVKGGISNDGNIYWFLADLAVYNELYPKTRNVLSDAEKQACVDNVIKFADTAVKPGDLSKSILALRSLGYDARNVYTKDRVKIDIVKKLTDLVDAKDSSVTNVYTLPYVILALLSGENYATAAQIDYLINTAVENKTSWQELQWGSTDAATPMILALSPFYGKNAEVKAAVDGAIDVIKPIVPESGLLCNSVASCGLAIAAFSSVGIDPTLISGGESNLIDGLISQAWDTKDGLGSKRNSFDTEQGFRGLVAWQALKQSEKRIYDFADYPMNEAHATWATGCPVTFNVIPTDAKVTVEGAEPVFDNNYDLAEGTYTYKIEKDGYISKIGTVTVSASDAENHKTKTVNASLSSSGGSGNAENNNSVTVKIKVMVHDSDECDNSYTYKHNSSKYSALVNESIELEKGQTVFDALDAVLTDNEINYVEGGYGYISSIDGLSEFDHGNASGWMFTVNGKHKNVGCRDVYLRSDSTVVWFYTDDYTNEQGSESFTSGSSVRTEENDKEKTEEKTRNIEDTAKYILQNVPAPSVSSIGGEWAVLGLARSSYDVGKEYYTKYYENVESYVKECEGVLHDKKYTEYARVILALSALGINPQNVAGYDLISPLAYVEKVTAQGLNGAVWALIALDSKNYQFTENDVRDEYITHILESQLPSGGFPISKSQAEANFDITAMAITALAGYKDRNDVKDALDKALSYLSSNIGNITSAESTAQAIVAVTACGISPESKEYASGNDSLMDILYSYCNTDGGFKHTKNDKASNLMATEQALYALAAAERFAGDKNILFNMNDVNEPLADISDSLGLSGKHADVNAAYVVIPGKSFNDILNHSSRKYIEALAERGIIHGKSNTEFEPDSGLTRAELAVLIVRGLGLTPRGRNIFDDVSEDDWFYSYVAACYDYGIISGISAKEFNPYGQVCVQEAAAIIQRAAKLCGMSTDMDEDAVRNTLASFTDYISIAEWAKASVAFCCANGIISDEETEILPTSSISRAGLSVMLYLLLDDAKLI